MIKWLASVPLPLVLETIAVYDVLPSSMMLPEANFTRTIVEDLQKCSRKQPSPSAVN